MHPLDKLGDASQTHRGSPGAPQPPAHDTPRRTQSRSTKPLRPNKTSTATQSLHPLPTMCGQHPPACIPCRPPQAPPDPNHWPGSAHRQLPVPQTAPCTHSLRPATDRLPCRSGQQVCIQPQGPPAACLPHSQPASCLACCATWRCLVFLPACLVPSLTCRAAG